MPAGPKGERRPADVTGAAVKSCASLLAKRGKITVPRAAKTKPLRSEAAKGGKKRAESMMPEAQSSP